MTKRCDDARAVLQAAYDEHEPSSIVGMFSGGHDSVCAVHLAMEWARDVGLNHFVAHINTGIGIEATREYVRERCAEYGWTLREYHPPVSYDEIVKERGFPGPAAHVHMYRRLKERPIRQLMREHKQHRHDRIMLVTGVRSEESVRRMQHVDVVQREGAMLWVAPIHDWTTDDKYAYIAEHDIPRNDVADLLHMSGECLCGAFAKPGELQFIRSLFPDDPVVGQIAELQKYLRSHHVYQSWGERPASHHNITNLCAHCDKWYQQVAVPELMEDA